MIPFAKYLISVWRTYAPPLIVKRSFYGLTVHFNIRDHLFYLFQSRPVLENFEPALKLLPSIKGMLWDVGCNAGLFSVRAAQLGIKVASFDISNSAINLLQRSAEINKLEVTTIPRAFTLTPASYAPPKSAHPENKITLRENIPANEIVQSITYLEAATTLGIPQLIKMDIEGAEIDFMRSTEFHKWLRDNKIMWLLEVHNPLNLADFKIDLPVAKIDTGHVLFNQQPPIDI